MKRLASIAGVLALALVLSVGLPASEAGAVDWLHGGSVGLWGGYQFSNEHGDFDTWKVGIDYEHSLKFLDFCPKLEFAVQIPFEYWSAEPKAGIFEVDTTTWAIIPTLKAYYQLLPELRPYVGAGLGYARTEYDEPIDAGENSFAWRVVAGAEYQLLPRQPFAVFGEYEYTSVGLEDPRPVIGLGHDPDLGGNAISGGVRLRF